MYLNIKYDIDTPNILKCLGIIHFNAKYAEYRKNVSFSPLAKVSSNGLLIPAVGVVLGPLSEGFILDAIYKNVRNIFIETSISSSELRSWLGAYNFSINF